MSVAGLAVEAITCPVHGDAGGRLDPLARIRAGNRCRACVVEALRATVDEFGHEEASRIYVHEGSEDR